MLRHCIILGICCLGLVGDCLHADESAKELPAEFKAFLADIEGVQTHDFRAWNEYRKMFGETKTARSVFGEILTAEPKLCAAMSGDSDEFANRFNYRLETLERTVASWLAFTTPPRTARVTLPQTAALCFMGTLPITSRFNGDKTISRLLCSPGIIVEWEKGPLGAWGGAPAAEHLNRWKQPDERIAVYKQILHRWATRPGAIETAEHRLGVARWFMLSDAQKSLSQEIVRNIDYNKYITETAFDLALELGDKDNRRFLAPILENRNESGYAWRGLNTRPQQRDVALATIIELSGQKPSDYGFRLIQLHKNVLTGKTKEQYLFPSVRERNQAFALCQKNFRQLGLSHPPKYEPGFVFVNSPERAKLEPLNNVVGKLSVVFAGSQFQIKDAGSTKTITPRFKFKSSNWQIKCWAFSPDRKYLAIGSGYREHASNYGAIHVYDVATGTQVGEFGSESDPKTGTVTDVAFSKDGAEIVFNAERWDEDGK